MLKETIYVILMGSDVLDSAGHKVGRVVEVLETDDVMDTMIIDTILEEVPERERTQDEFVYAVLEEVEAIDMHRVVLNIPFSELRYHHEEHTIRETIWDRVKHIFGG